MQKRIAFFVGERQRDGAYSAHRKYAKGPPASSQRRHGWSTFGQYLPSTSAISSGHESLCAPRAGSIVTALKRSVAGKRGATFTLSLGSERGADLAAAASRDSSLAPANANSATAPKTENGAKVRSAGYILLLGGFKLRSIPSIDPTFSINAEMAADQ
jgi:hypothetical protein